MVALTAMIRRSLGVWTFLLVLLGAYPGVAEAHHVPLLTGYVSDFAGVLSPATRSHFDARLRAYDQATTVQFVVATVKSLGGQDIVPFGVDAFAEWKIGQKGTDNGLLLLIAPGDHQVRFEVGYGLEGAITDGTAGDIIRSMTPALARADYDGAVSTAVEAALAKIDAVPVDQRVGISRGSTPFDWRIVIAILFLLAVIEVGGLATGNPFVVFLLIQFILNTMGNSSRRGEGGGFGGGGDGGFSGGGGTSGGGGATGRY